MSVVIRGFDKPKNCYNCRFNNNDCLCSITKGTIDRDDYTCDILCPIEHNAYTKDDIVAMLEELKTEIGKIAEEEKCHDAKWALGLNYSKKIIQKKISSLRGEKMEMTIDEIIKKEYEIAAEFQKVVDTHIVNDDGYTIDEMYCDDTEVVEEHLSRCKSLANYHKQIADTMSKYKEIEKTVNEWNNNDLDTYISMSAISEVVKNGND